MGPNWSKWALMSPMVPNGSRLVQMGQHGSQCIALQWIQMGPMGLKGTNGSKNGINWSWWVLKDEFLDRIYFGSLKLCQPGQKCLSRYASYKFLCRFSSTPGHNIACSAAGGQDWCPHFLSYIALKKITITLIHDRQLPWRHRVGKWLCKVRTCSVLWKHLTYCPGGV